MTFLPHLTPPALISHVPDGYDSLLLSELSKSKERIVFIARDETRANRIKEQLAFFEPICPIHYFPGWDCLPYDRVSPHPDILAQRLNTLTSDTGSYVLITTIQAFLQRLAPRTAFQGRLWPLKPGQEVDHALFLDFLTKNGYVRREAVREWGEFAIRGGLLDLFPPGYPLPFRLDFFGSTLESLRLFDPLTQVSTGKADQLILKPMGEISLTPEAIEHFRKGYRDAFGPPSATDPLYHAISEGRPYAGYEHWLPLFYESLETLADYTPGALYCLDDQLEEARQAHIDQIQDHYQTRLEFAALEKQGVPYHPLPPEALYMMEDEWTGLIPESRKVVFTPFSTTDKALDGQGKIAPSFTGLRASHENVFEAVKTAIKSTNDTRILVVGATQGSAERLAHILEEHGLKSLRRVQTYAEFLSDTSPALAVFDINRGFQAPGLWVMTEEDILGERIGRPLKTKKRGDLFIQEVSNLQIGDFVVHIEHGIGRYEGLETLDVGGSPHDCLKLVYEGGDKLFVPVENIEVLSRYGAAETQASLDKLGGVAWQTRKARIKKRLKDVADYLLKIAAARKLHEAETLHKPEGLYEEFTAASPIRKRMIS